jgi:hypothetical protein
MQKDTPQGHGFPTETEVAPQAGQGRQGGLKDQTGSRKHNPNPGSQGPHGSGEGITGMQPGAGHPRGR